MGQDFLDIQYSSQPGLHRSNLSTFLPKLLIVNIGLDMSTFFLFAELKNCPNDKRSFTVTRRTTPIFVDLHHRYMRHLLFYMSMIYIFISYFTSYSCKNYNQFVKTYLLFMLYIISLVALGLARHSRAIPLCATLLYKPSAHQTMSS